MLSAQVGGPTQIERCERSHSGALHSTPACAGGLPTSRFAAVDRSLPGKTMAVVPLAPAAVPQDIPCCAHAPLHAEFRCRLCLSWTGSRGIVVAWAGRRQRFGLMLHGISFRCPEERIAFFVPGIYDRARNGRAA